jgi:CubicO group peptidase (beta-lactamase class C family)
MTGELTARLASELRRTGVTGASLAYWDSESLHTAVGGLRNSVTGDPVTVDTVMHIGSITKVMNAVLMMQLVDEGQLALDDLAVTHVPDLRLRDREALQRITCGMLLNHTSGINGEWLPEYGPDEERIVDAIGRCGELDQLHAPGEATSYCNIATVIAGYITQRLRGESWYTLVKSRIYQPLGMDHALVDPVEIPRFRCSIGDVTDRRTGKLVQARRPMLAPSFAPAGATQMTTASDLVTFARALLAGGVGANGARILSADTTARMCAPTAQFFTPDGWQMGVGWMILPGGVLYHGGGGRGVCSFLYTHPASGRTLALLTNCDQGNALKVAIADPIVESWTKSKPADRQRLTGTVNPAPYVGVYQNNLAQCEVSVREGGLALRIGTTSATMGDLFDTEYSLAATLHPLGDHLFEAEYVTPGMKQLTGEFRFVLPGADGRMRFVATGPRLLKRAS